MHVVPVIIIILTGGIVVRHVDLSPQIIRTIVCG